MGEEINEHRATKRRKGGEIKERSSIDPNHDPNLNTSMQYIICRGYIQELKPGETPPRKPQYIEDWRVPFLRVFSLRTRAHEELKKMKKLDACKSDIGDKTFALAELKSLKPSTISSYTDWYMLCAVARFPFREKERYEKELAFCLDNIAESHCTFEDLYIAKCTRRVDTGVGLLWDVAKQIRDAREDASTNRGCARDFLHARRLKEYNDKHLHGCELEDIIEQAPARTPIEYTRANLLIWRHKSMLRQLYKAYDRGYDCAGAMQLIDNYIAEQRPCTWIKKPASPVEACATLLENILNTHDGSECALSCKLCIAQVEKVYTAFYTWSPDLKRAMAAQVLEKINPERYKLYDFHEELTSYISHENVPEEEDATAEEAPSYISQENAPVQEQDERVAEESYISQQNVPEGEDEPAASLSPVQEQDEPAAEESHGVEPAASRKRKREDNNVCGRMHWASRAILGLP